MTERALLLKRQVAARLLGISPSTFSAWVAVGILPASLPGAKMWSRIQLERATAGLPFVPPEQGNQPDDSEDLWAEYDRRKAAERAG